MPVEIRYCSAALAIERGQRRSAVRSSGTTTSQVSDQRGLREEGIDHGRVAIGHQRHVGVVDRLPAGDRRAVEHQAVGQGVFVDLRQVEGDVLPLAARVGEPPVDEFDFFGLDQSQDGFVQLAMFRSFPFSS